MGAGVRPRVAERPTMARRSREPLSLDMEPMLMLVGIGPYAAYMFVILSYLSGGALARAEIAAATVAAATVAISWCGRRRQTARCLKSVPGVLWISGAGSLSECPQAASFILRPPRYPVTTPAHPLAPVIAATSDDSVWWAMGQVSVCREVGRQG